MAELTNKLRGIRTMAEELAAAAEDRFEDLEALGESIRRLTAGEDTAVSGLGAIGRYLAQDSAVEIETKFAEILKHIDAAIAQAEGVSR